MRLKDYLTMTSKKGETQVQRCLRFAERLGVSHHTVLKWLNGQRNIKDPMKLKIEAITRGEVRIHDMMPR